MFCGLEFIVLFALYFLVKNLKQKRY